MIDFFFFFQQGLVIIQYVSLLIWEIRLWFNPTGDLNLDAYAINGIISYFPVFGIKSPNPMVSPNKRNKCDYVLEFLQNGHLTNRSEITNFMKETWMMEITLIQLLNQNWTRYLETWPVHLLGLRVFQYSVMLLNFQDLTKP